MKVADKYRTNSLSHTPGGKVVKVVFQGGRTLEYDKVKNPRSYVGKIEGKDGIIQIYVDDELAWTDIETKKYWEV